MMITSKGREQFNQKANNGDIEPRGAKGHLKGVTANSIQVGTYMNAPRGSNTTKSAVWRDKKTLRTEERISLEGVGS
jgi:hypothetical protein